MATFAAAELELLRDLVVQRIGLQFDQSKLELLAEVFGRRLVQNGEPSERYLARVSDPSSAREEFRHIAEALTVPETYFFRHFEQFRAFVEVALPDRMEARALHRQLRVLSAGCASGEEAYSLAILSGPEVLPGWQVQVEGVDINRAMLDRAAKGRYSPWSLREAPADLQRRWFGSEGRHVVLDPAVRARVRFSEHNLALADDEPDPWLPGSYDVIFCRNVIMYFTPDRARRVIDRCARALAPGGYLFLGSAESLRGVSEDFQLRHSHEAFYHQRNDVLRARAGQAAGPTRPSFEASTSGGTGWHDSVRRASERIKTLSQRDNGTDRGAPPQAACAQPPAGLDLAAPPEVAPAFELLRRERFADALAFVARLPAAATGGAEVALLRAVLLVHLGQIDPAEAICDRLLAQTDHAAATQHVLALCCAANGDHTGARRHDRAAAELDPSFAIPRLHLGLRARRQGEVEIARRELGQALVLLGAESPARLLLFAGGFTRENLIALCRAELARLESAVEPS